MTVTNLEAKKTPEETFREESKYFRLYGVTPDMYRQIFRGADRNIYRLVGLRTNARKNIFVVTKLPMRKRSMSVDLICYISETICTKR